MDQTPSEPGSLARNTACPCGSGSRFKHCCGAFALPEQDAHAKRRTSMHRALALQRAGRLCEARALYEQVLLAEPELPDALHMLGVVHLQAGAPRRALSLLCRAAEAFGWANLAVRHNLALSIAATTAEAPGAASDHLWQKYDRFVDRRRAVRRPFRGSVSVVIPSFNHAAYVEEAVESALRQTRPPDEIIVVDDGSTDSSVARIRAVLAHAPDRVSLRARANRGAAATINEAVASSRGDYVNVLNSDDRLAPTRIDAMIDAVAAAGASWGFSRVTCIDAAGAPLAAERSKVAAELCYMIDGVAARDTVGFAFLAGNPAVSTGNLFFSRRLFDRLQGFADLRYNHDWDFCLRATLQAEPVFVPSAQYDYRLHGANTILESSSKATREANQLFARFYDHALAARAPTNRFAPLPCIWGRRFFECALAAGNASTFSASFLEAWARRALADAEEHG